MALCTINDAGIVTQRDNTVSEKSTIAWKGAKITFIALLCLSPLAVGLCNHFKVLHGLNKAYKLALIGSGTGLSSVYLGLGIIYREQRKTWQRWGDHNGIKIEMATWNIGTDNDFWNTRILPKIQLHCTAIIQKACACSEESISIHYVNFISALKKVKLDEERIFSDKDLELVTLQIFKENISALKKEVMQKPGLLHKIGYSMGIVRSENPSVIPTTAQSHECCDHILNHLYRNVCRQKRQGFLQNAFKALRDNDVICLQERDGYSTESLEAFLRADDGTTLFTVVQSNNYTAIAVKKKNFIFVGAQPEDFGIGAQDSTITYWRHCASNAALTIASAHINGNPGAIHLGDIQFGMLASKIINDGSDIKVIGGDFNWPNVNTGRLGTARNLDFVANNGNHPTRLSLNGTPLKIDYVMAKNTRVSTVISNATKDQQASLQIDSPTNPSDHAPVETTLIIKHRQQRSGMQKFLEALF